MSARLIYEFIAGPLRAADRERREAAAAQNRGGSGHWQAAVVLISAAFLLTGRRYQMSLDRFFDLVAAACPLFLSGPLDRLVALADEPANWQLARLIFWALWQGMMYVAIPAGIVLAVFRWRLSDVGAKLRGMFGYWWVYLAMYVFMLPFIWAVSHSSSFLHTYPFLRPTGEPGYWPRFFIWQGFYAFQFVSLEFFFRGYMVHGTRRALGAYSILAMMIPYCMIHFQKPLLETLGAIAAGVVLGFMSLKTRSIWMGAALHIGVAVAMDLFALAQWG